MTPYTLALTEARIAVDRQVATLRDIRNRTLYALAIGILATLGVAGLGVANPLAYGPVGALAGFAVLVHWPTTVRFVQDAKVLVDWVDDHDDGVDKSERNLALYMVRDYEHNEKLVQRLIKGQNIALLLMAAQVFILGVAAVAR